MPETRQETLNRVRRLAADMPLRSKDAISILCDVVSDMAAELETTKRIAVDAGNDARMQNVGAAKYSKGSQA